MAERPITAKDNEKRIVERKEIAVLFPDLQLEEVFSEYSHLSKEAMINFIMEKRDQIPTKPPNILTRILVKTYMPVHSVAAGVARRLPSWLGGRILVRMVRAVECPIDLERCKRSTDLIESLECVVCWEKTSIFELSFCDPLASREDGPRETHHFCRSCLQQHALAAAEEMPLAKNCLGLCCMMTGCDNPITFHEIAEFLPPELFKKLEERAAEQSIIRAALNYMERCRKCNCAVELGFSPKVMPVFKCPQKECLAQFCRLCDEPWQDEHKGISCEEYAKRFNNARLLEKRLSETLIRHCPKCKMAFIKYDGCNKVTCKCGHTQCYICRTDNIDYTHFCRCPHAPKRKADGIYKCGECTKTCLLWESHVPLETQQMAKIREEAAEKEAKKTAKREKAGTSSAAAGTSKSKPAWKS